MARCAGHPAACVSSLPRCRLQARTVEGYLDLPKRKLQRGLGCPLSESLETQSRKRDGCLGGSRSRRPMGSPSRGTAWRSTMGLGDPSSWRTRAPTACMKPSGCRWGPTSRVPLSSALSLYTAPLYATFSPSQPAECGQWQAAACRLQCCAQSQRSARPPAAPTGGQPATVTRNCVPASALCTDPRAALAR